jgi:hypothetical protein
LKMMRFSYVSKLFVGGWQHEFKHT